jgi:hypothetical protein
MVGTDGRCPDYDNRLTLCSFYQTGHDALCALQIIAQA